MKAICAVFIAVHILISSLSSKASNGAEFVASTSFNADHVHQLHGGDDHLVVNSSVNNTFYIQPFKGGDTAYEHIWPPLELNWHVAVGTLIAFIGGSLGCAGGIGGGGMFVPMLVLIMGFDEKSSTALSKCMIMGASAASVIYNFRLKSPILDYDLALVFQPMLMLGISIGVIFNVIFPNWIVTIMLLLLFTGTALKTFLRALLLYKQETIEKLVEREQKLMQTCIETGIESGDYVALEPFHLQDSDSLKRHWKSFVALGYVWISFLILQIVKNYTKSCSGYYWLWTLLQVPVAASVFITKAALLYIKNQKTKSHELDEVAEVAPGQLIWTIPMLCFCAFVGLLAGTVGGLLGLGGGFIIGPLFLELGLPPEIASATASFIMLFSSSMSVIEYHLLHRFPVPFALYMFGINAAAAFWAQVVLRKLIGLLGRPSIIVFILSSAIFLSAASLGGYGIEDTVIKLQNHEYMGFLNLCKSS